MAQVIWTENALLGLREVVEYIELFNPGAASSLAQQVFEATDQLVEFPESCLLVEELPDHNFRQLLVSQLRLLYSYEVDKVTIVHVVRQERSLRKLISEG
ncbi:type II toxin-antitoxin system RelE/ParE family toxin [Umboniibacter marinipuniceus]|uniref:Toxin ParE1/3/4 n=1 Tax=Umboniibacter marinipuniceus TaxID=569599 RepID=A0A3M0A818_9GAMM|nr:type II toxin-antitoxin system RelE/ParE family toxin [Umboniibacter marinipuniceus]RMA80950.1 toxin ParE1/3/4 [Umboniibacter marinipuniceus]